MYTAYFGLRESPFAITPDPGYLYLSPHHQEALAHLLYGAGEQGGFVQLTGEVGTGKTTLIRAMVEQKIEAVEVALCLNPHLTVAEFVAVICDELGVNYPRDSSTLKPLIDALNSHLLSSHARGLRTVLIIDEAQNLARDVLEQLRLLTNLETRSHKLLRIILVGQPELQDLLARPDLRQLAQRITARYHLLPLDRRETMAYIDHRLRIAGAREHLFSPGAKRVVYRRSGGIPRLINVLCDRAMLGAYAGNRVQIDTAMVRQAAREVLQNARRGGYWRFGIAAAVGTSSLALVAAYWLGVVLPPWSPMPPPSVEIASASALARETSPLSSETLPPEPEFSVALEPEPVAPVDPEPKPDVSARSSSEKPLQSPPLRVRLFEAASDNPMQALLTIWGENVDVPPGVFPCEELKQRHLHCMHGKGDWEELRRFDRPALLRLRSTEVGSRWVLLRFLQQDRAVFLVAGAAVETAIDDLQTWWNGDYLLLWRLQTESALIGATTRGESILWLRQRLALIDGLTENEGSPIFDAGLQQRVKTFQRSNGLQADGLVGPQTMTLLNSLAPSTDTPFLRPATDDGE